MSERIRDDFRHRTELERRVLDLIVTDGVITRAALFDHFVVVCRLPPKDVDKAVDGLRSSNVIHFWNNTPPALEKWLKQHSLRRPILNHYDNPYAADFLFTSRTVFMIFTAGGAVARVFYGRPWGDQQLLEMVTEKSDELKRRW
jgi:hypothetical protein